jgi:hypothetical protein
MRTLPVTAAFGHVVRSTINNASFAWSLSWPWMIIIIPVNIFAQLYGFSIEPGMTEPSGAAVAVGAVVGLLTLFAFASIAVSWHRYILLDEIPQGLARLRADNTVWRYFGNTLLIFLILLAGFLPVGLLVGMLVAALQNAGAIISVPIYLAAIIFGVAAFYRMSVKLPAIALERKDFTLKEAWAKTQGNVWQLFGLALLFVLTLIGMGLVLVAIAYVLQLTGLSIALFLSLAIQMMFNWLGTIAGVTLLTSLYGFFIENRDF